MAKKSGKKIPKIFIGIPAGLKKDEREKAIEIVKSRYGEDFGDYYVPRRNGHINYLIKQLKDADIAMFADGYKADPDLNICYYICESFDIPIYK